MFHGDHNPTISLEGLDHVISVTADEEGAIYFRVYAIQLKKSGTKLPYVELEEMGPSMDMTVRPCMVARPDWRRRPSLSALDRRRAVSGGPPAQIRRRKEASPDVLKEAMKVPKEIKPKAVKNVITDAVGKTIGRIHVGKQDFSKIATKKMKGARASRRRQGMWSLQLTRSRRPRALAWWGPGLRKRAGEAEDGEDAGTARKRSRAADAGDASDSE